MIVVHKKYFKTFFGVMYLLLWSDVLTTAIYACSLKPCILFILCNQEKSCDMCMSNEDFILGSCLTSMSTFESSHICD